MGNTKNNRRVILQALAFFAFALQPILLPSQMPGGNGIFHSPMTLVNILRFNLGIEFIQLIVIFITVPWLIILSKHSIYKPIRITGVPPGQL